MKYANVDHRPAIQMLSAWLKEQHGIADVEQSLRNILNESYGISNIEAAEALEISRKMLWESQQREELNYIKAVIDYHNNPNEKLKLYVTAVDYRNEGYEYTIQPNFSQSDADADVWQEACQKYESYHHDEDMCEACQELHDEDEELPESCEDCDMAMSENRDSLMGYVAELFDPKVHLPKMDGHHMNFINIGDLPALRTSTIYYEGLI